MTRAFLMDGGDGPGRYVDLNPTMLRGEGLMRMTMGDFKGRVVIDQDTNTIYYPLWTREDGVSVFGKRRAV